MYVKAKPIFQEYIQVLSSIDSVYIPVLGGQFLAAFPPFLPIRRGGGGLSPLAVACQRFGLGTGRGGYQEGDAGGVPSGISLKMRQR